jgi:UTP-glucose-1-phosphate uridylyltransferase
MQRTITKAVFPVAGLGTRFLPATKSIPKEMLPIVDKPLLQLAAEEAAVAGIKEMIFVNGRGKWAIPDHFDKAYELEAELIARGKTRLLGTVRNVLPKDVTCVYIRQAEALGLGHAVLCAKPVVGDEPFAIILPDDLINGAEKGCLAQMVEVFAEHGSSTLCVERVPHEETNQYGIVSSTPIGNRLNAIHAIVEKPAPENTPSNLAVVGRYILTPRIFELLKRTERGAGGEIQLTDAIAKLLSEEQVLAYEFRGRRYDCGSKLGYLKATVEFGLRHPELGDDFMSYLQALDLSRFQRSSYNKSVKA